MTASPSTTKGTLFNVRPGEWRLVVTMLLLLAVNTMVYQISSVVATADFLGVAGAIQIPLLWIVGFAAIMIISSFYSLAIDRVPRIQLLSWMFMIFALTYLVIQLMIVYGLPGGVTSGVLYVLAELQLLVFPMAFWRLANDMYTVAESRRLFPLIAAGGAVGSILGSGVAALSVRIFTEREQNLTNLLIVGAVVFLAGLLFMQIVFRKHEFRARQDTRSEGGLWNTIQVGFDVVANVPLFRYLGLALLLVNVALTIIEYHFLFSVTDYYRGDSVQITGFYGIYQMVMIISIWVFQWLITGRFLQKAEPRNTFWLMPAACLIAVLLATTGLAGVAAILGAAGGRFVARVVETGWDGPARNALMGLVPDERRGRVSTFVDSYFFSGATIITSAVLIGLIELAQADVFSAQTEVIIYLALAGVAAAAGLWSIFHMRKVYDESLLNWRLSRSKRKSVLDGVEF